MFEELGEVVYKYTLKKGEFFVHEGVVIQHGPRKLVYFKARSSTVRYPKEEEFGVIQASGPSLWLVERDDELAKRLFIEYEEQCLAELNMQIERKMRLIKLLKKEL